MSMTSFTFPNLGNSSFSTCDSTRQCCPNDPNYPKMVIVFIKLSASVACPGHPLAIKAAGMPSGGTYSWTISGDGELVDGSGNPVNTGSDVNLRSFKPNDATGEIPAQEATVKVTYTHPNGTATDSKPVPIHGIKFKVTKTKIIKGVTQAIETNDNLKLGAVGIHTMVTDPKVKIMLDATCPRKTDCARNHRVGWLQTVLTQDRRTRYTDTLATASYPLPMRDGDPPTGPSPVPFYDKAPYFVSDDDSQTAHHFDSPSLTRSWDDTRVGAPKPPPPKNGQLRQIFFQQSFAAWLVVQNEEWKKHDKHGSFVYLKNFTWSVHLDVNVDMSQAVGSRCSPQSSSPAISAMSNGKGSNSPNMDDLDANSATITKITSAPTLP